MSNVKSLSFFGCVSIIKPIHLNEIWKRFNATNSQWINTFQNLLSVTFQKQAAIHDCTDDLQWSSCPGIGNLEAKSLTLKEKMVKSMKMKVTVIDRFLHLDLSSAHWATTPLSSAKTALKSANFFDFAWEGLKEKDVQGKWSQSKRYKIKGWMVLWFRHLHSFCNLHSLVHKVHCLHKICLFKSPNKGVRNPPN